MATDLNVSGVFPTGTQVSAYKLSDWAQWNHEASKPPKNVTPVNANVNGAVLSFSNLASGRYVAYAVVDGRPHFTRFTV